MPRRWRLYLALLFALGVLTPVLSAWFIWYAADRTASPHLRAARAEGFLHPGATRLSATSRFILRSFERPGLRIVTVRTVGYPWRCLAGARALYDDESTANIGLIPLSRTFASRPFDHSLPFLPRFPAFAYSVAAAIAAWWLLLGGPFLLARSIVRHRRVPAGRCIQCGYDLRGTPSGTPCPECGNHAAQTTPSADAPIGTPTTAPGHTTDNLT